MALSEKLIVHMAASVSLALAFVHKQGLVHLNVNPTAIAVTIGGRICLVSDHSNITYFNDYTLHFFL